MGKRTREKSDEEIRKKIKYLEKELKYRNIRNEVQPLPEQNELGDETESEWTEMDHRDVTESEILDTSDQENSSPIHDQAEPGKDTTTEPETDALPSEIIAILGESKKLEENMGKKIPQEIANRWQKIIEDGLAKEQKDSLITKILIPENFQLARAPKLNAEVASVVNDATKNRDKRLEKMQHQLGIGIAGLANLTAKLINNTMEKLDIIKHISEINQVLLDLHYEETMNRRRLLIPLLDKSFISMIQGVKRGKCLFGDNLGENIKTTKSIEKASLEIKKPQRQPFRRPTTQPGNFRPPPRFASGAGAARAPATTPRYYQPAAQPAPPATTAQVAPPAPATRRPSRAPARQQSTSQAQANRSQWQDRRSRR